MGVKMSDAESREFLESFIKGEETASREYWSDGGSEIPGNEARGDISLECIEGNVYLLLGDISSFIPSE